MDNAASRTAKHLGVFTETVSSAKAKAGVILCFSDDGRGYVRSLHCLHLLHLRHLLHAAPRSCPPPPTASRSPRLELYPLPLFGPTTPSPSFIPPPPPWKGAPLSSLPVLIFPTVDALIVVLQANSLLPRSRSEAGLPATFERSMDVLCENCHVHKLHADLLIRFGCGPNDG